MGQHEVLEWMEGKGWVSSKDILKDMGVGYISLDAALRSLFNHNEIQRKRDETKKYGYLYKL